MRCRALACQNAHLAVTCFGVLKHQERVSSLQVERPAERDPGRRAEGRFCWGAHADTMRHCLRIRSCRGASLCLHQNFFSSMPCVGRGDFRAFRFCFGSCKTLFFLIEFASQLILIPTTGCAVGKGTAAAAWHRQLRWRSGRCRHRLPDRRGHEVHACSMTQCYFLLHTRDPRARCSRLRGPVSERENQGGKRV